MGILLIINLIRFLHDV